MASILRLRKPLYLAPTFSIKDTAQPPGMDSAKWRGCVDWCLWVVGYVCTTWWLLMFLYAILPSTFIPAPELPGVRLRREVLHALHPVISVPGIVTGGLGLWEVRPCAEGLFRKRLWGRQPLYRDLQGVLEQPLSRLKSKIELMVMISGGKKVVVVPHSMGSLNFLYFLKWVEAPQPLGGGGRSGCCAAHVKAVMNIGPTFPGVPKAVHGLFSAEARDVAFVRKLVSKHEVIYKAT